MKNKGFTLVEMMVTITMFWILIGAVVGIFITGIRQQREILKNQLLLDQISYALEFMSRALRMASKESGQGCLSRNGLNYQIIPDENSDSGTGIKFINSLEGNDCQEFFLDTATGQLKYKKSTGPALPLNSERFQITSLKFNLIGKSEDDDIQPLVTLFLEVGGQKFQTSISQRNLDDIQ